MRMALAIQLIDLRCTISLVTYMYYYIIGM